MTLPLAYSFLLLPISSQSQQIKSRTIQASLPAFDFADWTGRLPAIHTPQAPPKPTVTLSPSTMTGT